MPLQKKIIFILSAIAVIYLMFFLFSFFLTLIVAIAIISFVFSIIRRIFSSKNSNKTIIINGKMAEMDEMFFDNENYREKEIKEINPRKEE